MRRTRLIRPEFFDDETIASLPVATRLFYIGLWTFCDDRGYFDRRPTVIAAAIFPYDGQARRLKQTEAALHQLEDAGRVKWLECGRHGIVPTLERHSIMGGRKTTPVADRHDKECLLRVMYGKSSTRPESPVTVSVSESVSGSSSESGTGRRGETDLQKSARDAGGFSASWARQKSL
jgi:hypothetical protein